MPGPFFAPATPPRGLLRIAGEDRESFLQGLVSNDVRKIGPSRGIWAALLTPQGKFLHDFLLTEVDGAYLLDGEGARIGDLHRRLKLFKLRAKVAIEDASTEFEVWHGWGEGAMEAFGLAAAGNAVAVEGGVALLDPRLAELGLRLAVPRGTGEGLLTAKGFAPSQLADWDALRLSLGVPDGSRDLELEKAILLENGFDELNGVAWDKGCYIGQELTARTKYRGLIKKRLMPVRLDGTVATGTIVTRPDGTEAGEIRSVGEGVALALIRLDALTDGTKLTAGDAHVTPTRPPWAKF